MIILKILGALDIAAAVSMVLLHYEILPWRIVFVFILYLGFKWYLFKTFFPSWIDLAAGIYMLIMLIFGLHIFLTFLIAGFLVVKALMSFF